MKKTIKKAQKGFTTADNTKVVKPAVKNLKSGPTYKFLKWVDEPTKEDSVAYKKGYIKGIDAKKKGEKNTSSSFGTSAGIRGFKEGYDKQRTGGKTMLKRADGSVSQRGLWDNIRANKGSGKKPTAQMLKQERKIKSQSKNK